jgi:hypothetical protein
MRGRRDRDAARLILRLVGVVEHRDLAGRLHNPNDAASKATKAWQSRGQAALIQVAVLGAFVSPQGANVSEERAFDDRAVIEPSLYLASL